MNKKPVAELEFYIRTPSLNGSYKCSGSYGKGKGHSHLYMAEEGKSFKRQVGRMLKAIYKEKSIDYPIKVWWQFFYKHERGRDLDSGLKIATDALNKIVYKDDNLIKKGFLEVFEPADEDQLKIKIYRLTEKELLDIERKKKNGKNSQLML